MEQRSFVPLAQTPFFLFQPYLLTTVTFLALQLDQSEINLYATKALITYIFLVNSYPNVLRPRNANDEATVLPVYNSVFLNSKALQSRETFEYLVAALTKVTHALAFQAILRHF